MVKIAVAQGGGPTAVINDTLLGILYQAGIQGVNVIGIRNGLEGLLFNPDDSLEDITDFDPKRLTGVPGAILGNTRYKIGEGDTESVLLAKAILEQNRIDVFLYIGGDDSARVIQMLDGIHVAKTVDNNLLNNHHTPGFGSACLTNAEMIKALAWDLGSATSRRTYGDRGVDFNTVPVVVYQAMGRGTGWLTYGSAFARLEQDGGINYDAAPNLFLPREVPFIQTELLDAVDNLLSGKGFVFIVVGEEIVNGDGVTLAKLYNAHESRDSFGHSQYGRSDSFSTASAIAGIIQHELCVEARAADYGLKDSSFVPNHIQRSLLRSRVDAEEAFDVGRQAVLAALDRESGISVGLQEVDGQIIPSRMPIGNIFSPGDREGRKMEPRYLGGIEGPTQRFYDDFAYLVRDDLNHLPYSGHNLDLFKR
tara:strand:- start:10192 stop:11457 length:1266 start_codon:yes stop_codon:yes gene_type:complete